mgnify:CR=1 FL=1
MIYAAHLNYDYEESMFTATDLTEVLTYIKDSFEAERGISDAGFSDEINDIYSGGNWKGFDLYAINPATGRNVRVELSRAGKACVSNHAMVPFVNRLKKQTAA